MCTFDGLGILKKYLKRENETGPGEGVLHFPKQSVHGRFARVHLMGWAYYKNIWKERMRRGREMVWSSFRNTARTRNLRWGRFDGLGIL